MEGGGLQSKSRCGSEQTERNAVLFFVLRGVCCRSEVTYLSKASACTCGARRLLQQGAVLRCQGFGSPSSSWTGKGGQNFRSRRWRRLLPLNDPADPPWTDEKQTSLLLSVRSRNHQKQDSFSSAGWGFSVCQKPTNNCSRGRTLRHDLTFKSATRSLDELSRIPTDESRWLHFTSHCFFFRGFFFCFLNLHVFCMWALFVSRHAEFSWPSYFRHVV